MPLLTTPDDLDPDATWEVVSNGRRLLGYLLDLFLLNALVSGLLTAARTQGWIAAAPLDPEAAASPAYLLPILLFSLGVQVAYYFLWEVLTHRTPGKLICQTRVMGQDGADPTVGQVLLRTLTRLVPLEPISFLGPLPGGWHDRWSGTYVVMRTDNLAASADDEDA